MLDSVQCVPCSGNETPLDNEAIKSYLTQIHRDWEFKQFPDRICRDYTFSNFMKTISFITSIASVAEEEGHHPNISLHDYNKLLIEVYTHKINGLHKNDFILAAKIDKAFTKSSQ